MTYQEKAQELIEKYAPIMPNENWQDRAKQCAIIAVDEILERYEFWVKQFSSLFQSSFEVEIRFWQEVKNELTK